MSHERTAPPAGEGASSGDPGPARHRAGPVPGELPLAGRRVVVTRPRAQAAGQIEALRALGAEVIVFPTIRVEPVLASQEIELMTSAVGSYDLVVFTSVNAVDCFFERLREVGKDACALGRASVVAVGPKTAAACSAHGAAPDTVPDTFVAEGVLQALAGRDLSSTRILMPRAREARETLPESFAAAGAVVDVVALYDTLPERYTAEEIELALGADYVTFTSGSAARSFAALLRFGGFGAELARVAATSIGPVTSRVVREEGMRVLVEAESYTIDGLVEAVVAHTVYSPGSG